MDNNKIIKSIESCLDNTVYFEKTFNDENTISNLDCIKDIVLETVNNKFKSYKLQAKQNMFVQMEYVDFIIDENNTYRFDMVKDFTVMDDGIIFNSFLDFKNELKDKTFDIITIGLERNVHFEFLKEYKKEYHNCKLRRVIKRIGNGNGIAEPNIEYVVDFEKEL